MQVPPLTEHRTAREKMAADGDILTWGQRLLGLPEVWKATRGRGVRVGVLDTGVDAEHPDLKRIRPLGNRLVAAPAGNIGGSRQVNNQGVVTSWSLRDLLQTVFFVQLFEPCNPGKASLAELNPLRPGRWMGLNDLKRSALPICLTVGVNHSRTSFRYRPGVTPSLARNTSVMWLWEAKPQA